MSIGLRMLAVGAALAGVALYLGYFSLMLRATRDQANVQLDHGRALRRLPKEVRDENQRQMVRRVSIFAALFLGILVVSGVVTMITGSPTAVLGAPIVAGFLLLVLNMVYSCAMVSLDMARRFAGWPDPGTVLLDLGCGWYGPSAARHAALFGIGAFVYAVFCLISGNWIACLVWMFIALLSLGSSAAGVGRIQLTERGLWKAPQFLPWRRVDRYVWADDGQCVALRASAPLRRSCWLIVPVPDGLRAAVDAILARFVSGAEGAPVVSAPGMKSDPARER